MFCWVLRDSPLSCACFWLVVAVLVLVLVDMDTSCCKWFLRQRLWYVLCPIRPAIERPSEVPGRLIRALAPSRNPSQTPPRLGGSEGRKAGCNPLCPAVPGPRNPHTLR